MTDGSYRTQRRASREWTRDEGRHGGLPLPLMIVRPAQADSLFAPVSQQDRQIGQTPDVAVPGRGRWVGSADDGSRADGRGPVSDPFFVVDQNSHPSQMGWLHYDRALDAFYHQVLP